MTPTIRPKSVVLGNDREIIESLLGIHARPDPVILDCTYGDGVMWTGMTIQPTIRTDIRQDLLDAGVTTHVADFRHIPLADHTVDVIVFDPPHLTEAGKNSKLAARYGLMAEDVQGRADISHLFEPFLTEAKRLLRKPGGIVLAKVADQVHRNKRAWSQVDYVLACRTVGLTPCDMVIKQSPSGGSIVGASWKRILHVRNGHSYWIVARTGRRCYKPPIFERSTVPAC